MGDEFQRLLHWVHEWEGINRQILLAALFFWRRHPYPVQGSVHSPEGADSLPRRSDRNESGRSEVANVAKEGDLYDISLLYGSVYSLLSNWGRVGSWPSWAVIDHLLQSSIAAWVEMEIQLTGGWLQMPTSLGWRRSPPELTWDTARLRGVWKQALEANRLAWVSATSALIPSGTGHDGSCGGTAALAPQPPRPDATRHTIAVLGTFGKHYNLMKQLLGIVFLRMNGERGSEFASLLPLAVGAAFNHNLEAITGSLIGMAKAGMAELIEEVADLGMIPWCTTDEVGTDDGAGSWSAAPPSGVYGFQDRGEMAVAEVASAPRATAGAEAQGDAGVKQWPRDAAIDDDTPRVIMEILEECDLGRLTAAVCDAVGELCTRIGAASSRRIVALALRGAGSQVSGATAPEARAAEHDHGLGGELSVPDISAIASALCLAATQLERLDGVVSKFFIGSSRASSSVSVLAHRHVAAAVEAFRAGLCVPSTMTALIDRWALPLLLDACHVSDARQRSASYGSRGTAIAPALSGRSGVHSPQGAAPSLVTFVQLIAYDETLVAHFEKHLATAVRRHLTSTLQHHAVPNTRGAREGGGAASPAPKVADTAESAALTALPHAVYQYCVYLVRMAAIFTEGALAACGSVAHVVQRATRRGVQRFFVDRESSVVLTLASALHAQVQDDVTKRGVATLPVIDAIADLVSLLSSKDLFVDCYSGLLAPRLMLVQRADELDVDIEVLSRMTIHLGHGVVATPMALVRDVRNTLLDPRMRMPPTLRLACGMEVPNAVQFVRVLCSAWWARHTFIATSADAMRSANESAARWYAESMVRGVEAFELAYRRIYGKQPVATAPLPGDVAPRQRPSVGASTSPSAQPRSADGGAALYADPTVLPDRPASDSFPSGLLESRTPVATADLPSERQPGVCGSGSDAERFDSTVGAAGEGLYGRGERRLSWLLCSGQVHITCRLLHPARPPTADPVKTVTLVAPPVAFLVLQLLDRYSTAPSPELEHCTLDVIQRTIPVEVPKSIVGSVLRGLLWSKLVQRDKLVNGSFVYRVASSFDGVPSKVVVDIGAATHHWVPIASSSKGSDGRSVSPVAKTAAAAAAHPSADPSPRLTVDASEGGGGLDAVSASLDTERMKKLEACIVRVMKGKRRLDHSALLSLTVEQLQKHFAVTAPMFKECVAQLIEREYIARENVDLYVYLA